MSPPSQKSFTDYQDDARHIVQAVRSSYHRIRFYDDFIPAATCSAALTMLLLRSFMQCVERVLKSGGVEQAASASQLEQWCERISGDAVSALHEHPPLNGFKIAGMGVDLCLHM
jgi:hypothetical protein